jgi:hypothetical protein
MDNFQITQIFDMKIYILLLYMENYPIHKIGDLGRRFFVGLCEGKRQLEKNFSLHNYILPPICILISQACSLGELREKL